MAKKNRVKVLASASRASGNHTIDPPDWLEAFDDLLVYVPITAAGTTLALDLQVSADAGVSWATLGNICTGITTATPQVKAFQSPIGSSHRIVQTSTGNFTYEVWFEGSRRGTL